MIAYARRVARTTTVRGRSAWIGSAQGRREEQRALGERGLI